MLSINKNFFIKINFLDLRRRQLPKTQPLVGVSRATTHQSKSSQHHSSPDSRGRSHDQNGPSDSHGRLDSLLQTRTLRTNQRLSTSTVRPRSGTILTISLQFLIEDLLTVVRAVKLEVRPLFLPHLVKLTDIIADGLHKLTWVSADWKNFVDRANDAIKRFKVLVKFCVWKEQK
jgi:hypothetical protein